MNGLPVKFEKSDVIIIPKLITTPNQSLCNANKDSTNWEMRRLIILIVAFLVERVFSSFPF